MSTQTAEYEFEFTDSEFRRLRDLVHARTGIALSDAKRELVYGRLARRLRKLNLASFAEYCQLVERADSGELQELTNAITTNLTSFFRENYHFEQLASQTLPQLESEPAATQRLRLWSAGCSTGEEPYCSPSSCANASRTCPTGTSRCSPRISIRKWWPRPPRVCTRKSASRESRRNGSEIGFSSSAGLELGGGVGGSQGAHHLQTAEFAGSMADEGPFDVIFAAMS